MIGRLGGLGVAALIIGIVAGVIGEHTAEFALGVVKAACLAVMAFTVALAMIMDHRWRQMAATGSYPRRRSTLLLPLTLGVLIAVFVVAVQPTH